ncbi:hypothetical protein E2C01_058747 [Portunus trituberculatus]|uniref:Uncharacterized protein n=1 Tax=Portunus trituberculatus TaxID=210409 RepID=A0A5B7H3W7_PORTR|nr:hypothetical protein [Portunus trituberculatus]
MFITFQPTQLHHMPYVRKAEDNKPRHSPLLPQPHFLYLATALSSNHPLPNTTLTTPCPATPINYIMQT